MLSSNTLIKFVCGDGCSKRGFQYNLGLNIDNLEFNPSGQCRSGGLYYTTVSQGYKWINRGNIVAIIRIPDDAKVYNENCGTKSKADKFIIENFITVEEFLTRISEEDLLKYLCHYRLCFNLLPTGHLNKLYEMNRPNYVKEGN